MVVQGVVEYFTASLFCGLVLSYRIERGGYYVEDHLNYLYEDSEIYLDRKYEIYKNKTNNKIAE